MIWERFKRKKEEVEIPIPKERPVHDELMELKEKISSQGVEQHMPEKGSHYPSFPTFELGKTHTQELKERKDKDIEHKLEMILTKLELINERLKVIEEKIEKRGF